MQRDGRGRRQGRREQPHQDQSSAHAERAGNGGRREHQGQEKRELHETSFGARGHVANSEYVEYFPFQVGIPMIANLRTLVTLAETQSMVRAATRLRLTQSAVSKRVRALENELGVTLVERSRHGATLTPRGLELVERARPLLAELARSLDYRPGPARLSLAVSESLLASWAPELLARTLARTSGLELQLSAHRGPVAVELVHAGEYDLALVAGSAELSRELYGEELGREPMVVVGARGERVTLRRGQTLEVWCIEPTSATWRALRLGLQALARERDLRFEVVRTLQSFSAIVQLARAGFGHALVPRGIARAMGVPQSALASIPAPGLSRPITLFGRKTAFQRPEVTALARELAARIGESPKI